jgi:hypothetical protein
VERARAAADRAVARELEPEPEPEADRRAGLRAGAIIIIAAVMGAITVMSMVAWGAMEIAGM